MLVILMRHGEASEPTERADGLRHLTLRGRELSRDVARALVAHGIVPTHIYTSPLVRAVQTAEILAYAAGHPGPIAALESLVPGGGKPVAVLAKHGGEDRVALVTHEPTVHALAGELTGGGPTFPTFRTSGVAVITIDDARRGALLGRLDPSTLAWRRPDDLGP